MHRDLRRLTRMFAVCCCCIVVPVSLLHPQQADAGVVHIATFGRGMIVEAAWSPDGQHVVVNTNRGAWVYDDQFEHRAFFPDVRAATFSPDGAFLAAASVDQPSVYIWHLETDALINTLQVEDGTYRIETLAWSPDGAHMALGFNAQLELIDLGTSERVVSLALDSPVVTLAWKADGQRLAVGRTGYVDILDTSTWGIHATLPVEGRPIALWSPDQQWLATLAADFDGGYQTVNALHVWTDDGRQLETVIQIGNVRALTWMPDSIGLLAEHYADNQTGEYQLRQWDARTGAVLAHSVVDLAVYQPILSIATSADGRRLLIAVRDNSVRLYDLASAANQVPRLLTGHSGVVSDIVWSASGAYVVTSSADGVVRMWDVAAQSEVQRLQVPARQALSLSWSPDSTHLAVGTDRSTIVMYDRSLNTDVLFSAHGAEIWNTGVAHLAWSPGGDMLASSGRDHEILIRDTQAFEIIRRFEIGPVSSPLDWDAAGSRLAFANFSGWVWDADTADMFSFDCQEENVLTAVAISPDGRLAAGTGPNVFGCVWDIDRDRYVVSLNTLGVRLDWSPDGEKLAALVTDHFINETTLQIWRTSSWNVLTSIEAESDLHTIAWSPDSQYIAAGDDTGLVHIWALRSFSQSP